MLGLVESDMPESGLGKCYCIIERHYEKAIEADLEAVRPGLYTELQRKAAEDLGQKAGKALIARYMARKLVKDNIIPPLVKSILNALDALLTEHQDINPIQEVQPSEDSWDDDIPL